MDKVLTVNGVDFTPFLKDFKVDIEDLDSESTARNAEGTMTRDRVAIKHKITLLFTGISPENLSTILTAVSPVSVMVTYTDPVTNNTKTGEFYAGPRNTGSLTQTVRGIYHEGATFNLIEL